jgi:hypothetical protein
MPRQSIWDRQWTVRNADGPGAKLIYPGSQWSFGLQDVSGCFRQFQLNVTAGTAPTGWGNFPLSTEGWTVFRWLEPQLPVWSPSEKATYDARSRAFLTSTGADVEHLAFRLEGSLDASHTVKLILVPDAVDDPIPDLLLISVFDVAGGTYQSGTGQGDPR